MRKKEVLTGKREFNLVYKKGKSLGDRYVVFFYRKNSLPYSRVGFLASKKVGNAVMRNRARRLMKESFRQMEALPRGYDMIFIARNTIGGKTCQDVKGSMESALRRSRLGDEGKTAPKARRPQGEEQ